MNVFVQRTPVSRNAPFDPDLLKQHLRVDGRAEDQAIGNIGMTAAADVEQFAQVALVTQDIEVTVLDASFHRSVLTFPIGPLAKGSVPTITMDGENFTAFDHVGGVRPAIRFNCDYFDLTIAKMVIRYRAGFGDSAGDIPPDLAQAIMDQAALHYDGRSPMDAKSLTTSPHMARVGARYRGVRV